MADSDHVSPTAHTRGEDPPGSLGAAFGWALIPLIPSLIIVAYFLLDAKIHL